MSQDSSQIPHQSRRKCANCGLVNAGSDEQCRRCGALLADDEPFDSIDSEALAETKPKKRGLLKRVTWVVGASLLILTIWYVSLLMSSTGLQPDQRERVDKAIAVLQQSGFTREAFILNHLTSFRSTDNWWNSYIGHHDAYAATNFPFEVVTLYPEFFALEDAALQTTWKSKQRLGWTSDKYNRTQVWDATEDLTKARFPYMFQCGADGQSDCY